MFRSRGENLRSVFVLLFLNAAFFLLQVQDPGRYARVFAFERGAVAAGEIWRVLTWQFTQSGSGPMQVLSLFITLMLLYVMGATLEDEWGTSHFLAVFFLSTFTSAGVAALLGVPLLGSFFVYFTLLLVYAAAFPGQTFYFFGIIPVRVRLLAAVAFAILLFGIFRGGITNLAALGGAAVALAYYLTQRVPARAAAPVPEAPVTPVRIDTRGIHNAARFTAIRKAVDAADAEEVGRLIAHCERDVVAGVNICPPADYKPGAADGYCVRCEGFAECSVRYLRSTLTGAEPAQG